MKQSGQGIQQWTNKWKTAFKKFEVVWSALQNFKRLSSTNFTWSILEYLDPVVHHSENSQVARLQRKASSINYMCFLLFCFVVVNLLTHDVH